ncbi:MAG: cytochrome c [Pseudorhodobacter sp.]
MIKNNLRLSLAAALLFVSGSAVFAQEDLGAASYRQYCATCHGASGVGDGPLTEMMTTKVADLTQLSAQNDGEFPMLRVLHVIDGRTGLRGHGGPMPVYGALFESEAGDTLFGSVIYTKAKVLALAYYLEGIQAK